MWNLLDIPPLGDVVTSRTLAALSFSDLQKLRPHFVQYRTIKETLHKELLKYPRPDGEQLAATKRLSVSTSRLSGASPSASRRSGSELCGTSAAQQWESCYEIARKEEKQQQFRTVDARHGGGGNRIGHQASVDSRLKQRGS